MSGATAWLNIILACAPAVHPTTVQGIMQQESGGKPFVIGINTKSVGRLARQPNSMAEAIAWARWLRARNINFDAGLMQVNSANWNRLGLKPENVFDPCTNVRAGAKILTDNYVTASKRHGPGQRALLEAFSIYNTGNRTAGFSNGYVRKVSTQAARFAGVAPPFVSAPSPAASPSGRTPTKNSGGVAPAYAWQQSSTWGVTAQPNTSHDSKKESAE